MQNKAEIIKKLNSSNSIGEHLSNCNHLSPEQILKINQICDYLNSCGVKKNDSVAIISNTREEWVLCDIAILLLGAVSVSIYQSLTPSEIAYILYDSQTCFVIIENEEQLLKIKEILSKSWLIPKIEDRDEKNVTLKFNGALCIEDTSVSSIDLHLAFYNSLDKNVETKLSFNNEVKRDDIASIVYTSGTTGAPKGVLQTHGNHLSNIRQVLESGLMPESGSIFLFLPLAHSFGRLMAYISLFSELSLKFPSVSDRKYSKIDNALLAKDLRKANSDIIPVVPRLLEKIKNQIETLSHNKNFSGKLLSLIIDTASRRKKRFSLYYEISHFLLSPLRKKICSRVFGANFKYAVSGGAKLPTSVHEFFDNLGIIIVQGYGLTETCVATNSCRPNNNKIGSVGPVLSSDIEMKILEDGEIAFRGPNIAKGYHNRPLATKSSWVDGSWFLTGDLGSIDEDGFLYITGRKKELIATSGGKKIPPLVIEEKILEQKLFSQAVVIGEGQKYLSAILYLNNVELEKALGKNSMNANSDEINVVIYNSLRLINQNLASFESIKKFIISPFEFTVENSFLTPSHKIKRNEVEKYFKKEIELLYLEDN